MPRVGLVTEKAICWDALCKAFASLWRFMNWDFIVFREWLSSHAQPVHLCSRALKVINSENDLSMQLRDIKLLPTNWVCHASASSLALMHLDMSAGDPIEGGD